MPIDDNPFKALDAGQAPPLSALGLHNSTVYSWNRPCYGVRDGVPHLRIECRYIAAGPSVLDEMANAAFWIGCMLGGAKRFNDVPERLDFDDAKGNFLRCCYLQVLVFLFLVDCINFGRFPEI